LAFDGKRCRNFTINGTPIGEKIYDGKIKAVCNIRECFAMVGEDNELAMYDVHTLLKLKVIYRYDAGILAVKFRRNLNLAVCTRADNALVLAFIDL
jgi:hypothetical protein